MITAFKMERNSDVLMKTIKLLTHLSKQANMNCSPVMISFIASPSSSRFTASLRLSSQFFTYISLDRHYHCTIFIDAFYQILRNFLCPASPSMTLAFSGFRINHSILLFRRSSHPTFVVSGLVLLPYRRTEVGEIDYRYFFSIDVEQFKHIVTELHYFYHDPIIVVTMTDSQVKFSVGAIQIVLTKEENQCIIGRIGLETEVETQFLLILHPKEFFLDLAMESEPKRIWFFKSTDSCTIIAVPCGLYAQIWVYFPQKV